MGVCCRQRCFSLSTLQKTQPGPVVVEKKEDEAEIKIWPCCDSADMLRTVVCKKNCHLTQASPLNFNITLVVNMTLLTFGYSLIV